MVNIDSTFFIILKMAQSQRKQTSRKWTKAGRDMKKTYRCPLRPGQMGDTISAGLQWELVAYSAPGRVSKGKHSVSTQQLPGKTGCITPAWLGKQPLEKGEKCF